MKLIWINALDGTRYQQFTLDKDPGETVDLISSIPAPNPVLQKELISFVDSSLASNYFQKAIQQKNNVNETSEKAKDQLQSIGYLLDGQ